MTPQLVLLCAWSALGVGACLSGESRSVAKDKHVASPPAIHAVSTAAPIWLNGLATGEYDAHSERVTIRCATCHELLDKSPALPLRAEGAAGPHEGLKFAHGELRCAACHDRAAVHMLRLADGSPVGLVDAIELCSQCHGLQARDYRHGAHGGMRGYWDLSRGPRERNTCVSCHDPHEPRYPTYLPAPAPRDRFAERGPRHD